MRLIVTCGGTGGHITPALAIADTVRENCARAEILFVGSEGGMEEELVRRAGYPIRSLRIKGLARNLSPANIRALYLAVRAVGAAEALLSEFSPDAVVGTGGYACYPTLRAAVKRGIPTAVHESNAFPGLAVRRLAARVDRVWLNFADAAKHLSPRTQCLCVGNPLPRGYGAAFPAHKTDGKRRVLSFGGSLGARELNRAVLAVMERERELPEVYHCHATGRREYETVLAEFRSRGLDRCPRFELLPYIDDMPQRMAEADLVICRAGAMSISELSSVGAPAILVPSPNVTGDHQYKNAKVLADAGAAVLLTEGELQRLAVEVVSLLNDPVARGALSKAIGGFASPDANKRIYEDLCRLLKK